MPEHPIEGLMKTAMESLKDMVDVNTILGDPVETPDGSVILPVSRVSFGFAAGGSEFGEAVESGREGNQDNKAMTYPFGGGSGGGVSVSPVAFLVVSNGQVRLLSVEGGAVFDRLIDLAPQVLQYIAGVTGKRRTDVFTRPNVQGNVQ